MTDADDAEAFWREAWADPKPTCPVCGAPVNSEGCTVELGHDSDTDTDDPCPSCGEPLELAEDGTLAPCAVCAAAVTPTEETER